MRYYKELEVAKELAVEAGKAVTGNLQQVGLHTVERKEDDSPVTTADRTANAIIVAGLGAAFPDTWPSWPRAWTTSPGWGRITAWLVDPLDGTKEFIKGNDEFSVNIALVFKGQPVPG